MQRGRSSSHPSHGNAFSPDDLARDFGPGADVTRDGVRALYHALAGDSLPAVQAALDRWKRLVSSAYGHDVDRPSAAVEALAECYGAQSDRLRPAELLFALHTYYALVVKLLVAQAIASRHGMPTVCDRLTQVSPGDRLRREVDRLEAGEVLRELNVAAPLEDDLFGWYPAAWNAPLERMVRRLAERLGRYDAGAMPDDPAASRDLLKGLYSDLFPRRVRHALGEYYTPDWLAGCVLDDVGYQGDPRSRLLDPACGSGTFLVAAVNRVRQRHEARGDREHAEPGRLCRQILAGVVGFDLNPLAVLSARANYLLAICDLLVGAGPIRIPVFLRDSILHAGDDGHDARFDFVVGNPPWIAWDDLPDDYRDRSKPLWHGYGLFSLGASAARHGGAKKDLSMLMLYAAADRYLKHEGRLGMVVTQTLFQSKGAGDGFRRFRLGDGGPGLRVLKVNDLVRCRPFPGAANWTATVTLEKGSPTTYPVPYVKWSREPGAPEGERDGGRAVPTRRYLAEPIDADRRSSPWLLRPEGLATPWARLVGSSDYRAHLGANTGGANGVYWLTLLGAEDGGVRVRNLPGRAKRHVDSVEQVIEPDLLYPLVRWAGVAPYRAVPSAHLLLAQDVDSRRGIDEATMRERHPNTYAYLKRFADALTRRAAYRRYQHQAAFYSMYNVGPYTVAPIKVVWRRMDRRMSAAVVEPVEDPLLGLRPVIPQETCVLVAAESSDEAHYLCAVLNSAVVGFLVSSHSVRSGKGFGTPSILDYVRLRRFAPHDPIHAALAAGSREAHEAAERGESVARMQHEIDRLAARLWGLGDDELEVMRGELEPDG